MRTWMFTLAFCKAGMLADCLDNLYASSVPMPSDIQHLIIDGHYPINEEENCRRIAEIAPRYGCRYVDAGHDRGMIGHMNLGLASIDARPDDILLGCDPDDRPSPGWAHAVQKILGEHRWIGVAALSWDLIHKQRAAGVAYREEFHSGHRIWLHPFNEMWRVSGGQLSYILATGGFRAEYRWYGGIEATIHEQRMTAGCHLAYLPDFTCDYREVPWSDPDCYDSRYKSWKDAHIAGDKRSFGEWLKGLI